MGVVEHLRSGGDAGLRTYYREKYQLSADAVAGHLQRGDLVHDMKFATFNAES